MPNPHIENGSVWEDAGSTLMSRVIAPDGSALQQADATSIAYCLYKGTETTVTTSSALTVASVVYDTLQTDAIWTKDSTGYNFKHVISSSTLSDPNTVYRAEYWFTPASGEVFPVVFELTTEATRGPCVP